MQPVRRRKIAVVVVLVVVDQREQYANYNTGSFCSSLSIGECFFFGRLSLVAPSLY